MTMKITKILSIELLLLVFPMLKAQTAPIYTYSVPPGGYAPNGNLMNYTDSVNGTWGMQYDNLNRLQSAAATAGPYQGLSLQLQYDSFGNRLNQTSSGSPSVSVSSAWATYGPNNQMLTSNMAPGGGILYDLAGNMTFDGVNQLLYDAENRVCAAYNSNTGSITQYLYNAEGQRVAKGHPAVSTTTLACPTGSGDFTPTETYILGQSGEQVTQLDGSGQWQHTNVYAAGQLLATYDYEVLPQKQSAQLLHFNISDPLGTKRLQTSSAGVVESTCTNLPFGEGPSCIGATEHFFTGKERDNESGLDDFGARYYSSVMGRFMSPDPLPLSAKLDNPQSWNRYSYALNSPLSITDPEGLYPAPAYNCSDTQKSCLNDDQRRILENSKIGDGHGNTLSGAALYGSLSEAQSNAFTNVTDRLASVSIGDGNALSQVSSVSGIAGDRIYANVSSSLFSSLQSSGNFETVPAHGAPYNGTSFKDNDRMLGNIQFTFNQSKTGADIDIDIGNIKNGLAGALIHSEEVLQNKITGSLTNQDTIRKILVRDPKVQTITPSTDPKWNRK